MNESLLDVKLWSVMQQIVQQGEDYLNNLLCRPFLNSCFNLKNLQCRVKIVFNLHLLQSRHKKAGLSMEIIMTRLKRENISNFRIQKHTLASQLYNSKNKMKLQVLFQKFNPTSQAWKINLLQKLARIKKRDFLILVADLKMLILLIILLRKF